MKTFSQKPADVKRKWHLIDAKNESFGRISTVAASLLIGKGKPTFTSHVDGGDFVVIINANSMKITGEKAGKKLYHNYSGYPGGLRSQTLSDLGNVKALEKSVRGMLPVNKLRRGRLARLKIYETEEHNHTAQSPEKISMKEEK